MLLWHPTDSPHEPPASRAWIGPLVGVGFVLAGLVVRALRGSGIGAWVAVVVVVLATLLGFAAGVLAERYR